MLQRYADPVRVFERLAGRLSLASTALRDLPHNGEQVVETSLAMLGALGRCWGGGCCVRGRWLQGRPGAEEAGTHTPPRLRPPCLPPPPPPQPRAGETAACCAEVELHCYFLLCGHAAGAPGDIPVVAAALDWLAARLGYPHRHAYAAWHQRPLLFYWFGAQWELQHWVELQRLVAPTPEAAAADVRSFLAASAPALTATLVFSQRGDQLEALAQALGTRAPAALPCLAACCLLAVRGGLQVPSPPPTSPPTTAPPLLPPFCHSVVCRAPGAGAGAL